MFTLLAFLTDPGFLFLAPKLCPAHSRWHAYSPLIFLGSSPLLVPLQGLAYFLRTGLVVLKELTILLAILGTQLVLASNVTQAPIEKPEILLGLGEQRLVLFPGLNRYSIGDSFIFRTLRVDKKIPQSEDSLLLKGVAPGVSDLWIWLRNGTAIHRSIRVVKWKESDVSVPLMKAAAPLEEVEVIPTGKGLLIRGEIASVKELLHVETIKRAFPDETRDITSLSPPLLNLGLTRLKAWLESASDLQMLRVESYADTPWIRGSVSSAAELASIKRASLAVFPRIEFDVSALPDAAPTVSFRVFLLEAKRDEFTSFGLNWPEQSQAFQIMPWGIENTMKIDVALQALAKNGSVRVLSKPILAVRAPGEAELFSGGELPVVHQSRYGSKVEWKKFGLTLKLIVTHFAGNRVRLEVQTEVSEIDAQIAADQVPGLRANRLRTQIDAEFGRPLLLSGLLHEGWREQARGLPILRDIPILGALFGSEDFLNEQSELIAILLPHSQPPPAPMHRFESSWPVGRVPAPRNWISPSEERALENDFDFPWNALQ